MNIGSKIKNIRQEKGLTQKQLAQLTGLSEISIRKYESNSRNPKIENIKKIAKALDIETANLVNWNDLDLEETSELIGELSANPNDSEDCKKGLKLFARINYSIFEVLDYATKLFPDQSKNIVDFLESDEWSEFNEKIHDEYEKVLKKLLDKDIDII